MDKLVEELNNLIAMIDSQEDMYESALVMNDPQLKEMWLQRYNDRIKLISMRIELLKIKIALNSKKSFRIF